LLPQNLSCQPNNHWNSDPDRFGSLDDPPGNAVTADNPAKDIHQNGLDSRIGKDDAESFFDSFGRSAAADIEKMAGSAPPICDIHGRHCQTGTVDHATHTAVEFDVIQMVLRRFDLQRIFFEKSRSSARSRWRNSA
jgi:hypothetical protein